MSTLELGNESNGKAVAIIVHYGEISRTVRAALNHIGLGIFSSVVVVANDLSTIPDELVDFPCQWLIPARNLGFGSACQAAARSCAADIYAFFNAHVIMDKESAQQCIEACTARNVGIAAPYLYHPARAEDKDNWRYAFCTRTYSRILRLPIQVPLPHAVNPNDIRKRELIDNDWATGGAIFCRGDIVADIGWDGSYFLGFEDVDISARVKQRGWRIVVVPSAIAYHTGESTRISSTSSYYSMRNAIWFCRKYHGMTRQILLSAFLIALLARVAAADILKGRRPAHSPAAVRGILDGWRLKQPISHPLADEPLA